MYIEPSDPEMGLTHQQIAATDEMAEASNVMVELPDGSVCFKPMWSLTAEDTVVINICPEST